jgi:hypothetical protein
LPFRAKKRRSHHQKALKACQSPSMPWSKMPSNANEVNDLPLMMLQLLLQ